MLMEQAAVELFHKKHCFPIGYPIGTRAPEKLQDLAKTIHRFSRRAIETAKMHHSPDDADVAHVRVHLILEELAEMAEALAQGDKVGTADAIADLLYVVLGAAVSFNLPLEPLFWEVQRSNMSKAARDPHDTRLRDKGPQYSPPDIAGVLKAEGAL